MTSGWGKFSEKKMPSTMSEVDSRRRIKPLFFMEQKFGQMYLNLSVLKPVYTLVQLLC